MTNEETLLLPHCFLIRYFCLVRNFFLFKNFYITKCNSLTTYFVHWFRNGKFLSHFFLLTNFSFCVFLMKELSWGDYSSVPMDVWIMFLWEDERVTIWNRLSFKVSKWNVKKIVVISYVCVKLLTPFDKIISFFRSYFIHFHKGCEQH